MTLRALDAEQAGAILDRGGLLIDLRPVEDHLARHIRGSVPLLFEAGPGLGTRARDLLPLGGPLALLEDGTSPLDDAAASLRGKGFEVVGYLPADGWPEEAVAATPAAPIEGAGPDLTLLHVGDPGAIVPEGVLRIPAEHLWGRAGELDPAAPLGILAGWGVWAAAAIGILERLGFGDLTFVRTRPRGAAPPMAGPEAFRVGGPSG